MPPQKIYPQGKPYRHGFLQVDSLHRLSFEEFGNPDGIPIVFLHGGPGGAVPDFAHQLFDPEAFRIVVYDQRGCGQSEPHGEIKDNSPGDLVEDLEKLRKHLLIDAWHVFGGSWGSTLALLYAQAYPEKTKSLTLRGIFLMRRKEIDWFINDMGTFFPENQEEFVNHIPENERGNLLEAYYQRLTHPDAEIHLPAAHKWARLENGACRLHPPHDAEKNEPDKSALAVARIEAHFFCNHLFMPDDRLLKNIGSIRHIPTFIVQGRYDVVCPPFSAHDLKQAFPEACLQMVIAGHSAKEPEILKALMAATDRIRDTGSPVFTEK